MPKRDAVGRKAVKYLDAIEAEAAAKLAKDKAKEILTAAMQKYKRANINVKGNTITLREKEAQLVLKVKKAES